MAGPLWFDRIRETSGTSGTGAITPSGAFDASFKTIGAVLSPDDTAYFTVKDGAGAWNTFLGTWNGTTIARTTILDGSAGLSAVDLSGTGVEIWIDAPADWLRSRARMGDLPKTTQAGNYTLLASDRGKLVEFTGAAASTITLLPAADAGAGWWCILKHAGTGTTAAAQKLALSGTLDGAVNAAVYPCDTRIIQSDGTSLTSVLLRGGRLVVTASDSPFTFVRPPGLKQVSVELWGGGGSAGGGSTTAAATNASGGAGGGGGVAVDAVFAAADLPESVTVTIGAGAVGGAGGVSGGSAGSTGAQGGTSSFGALLYAYGGGGGWGGASSPGAGGGGGAGLRASGTTATSSSGGAGGSLFGASGGGSGATGGSERSAAGGGGGGALAASSSAAGGTATRGGGGGASGGGLNTSNTAAAGGATNLPNASGTNAGGVAPGGNGSTPAAWIAGTAASSGGPGGAANAAGNGGNGANGATPGGGGGGGGAARTGSTGGNGGDGGDGMAIIAYE